MPASRAVRLVVSVKAESALDMAVFIALLVAYVAKFMLRAPLVRERGACAELQNPLTSNDSTPPLILSGN